MKEFYERLIQPQHRELSELLNVPVPYISYKQSYPLNVDVCNHLAVRYIEQTMTIKGNSILVMEPFCENCERFVGESE